MKSLICPACKSGEIEVHETVDNKHYCSCIDCGKIFTKDIFSPAFKQGGNQYYFFPLYSTFFAVDKCTLRVLKIGFTKKGMRKKREEIEQDETIINFIFPLLNKYRRSTK